MTEKKPTNATGSHQEKNIHAQNGYEAGKATARELSYPLWTGQELVDKASDAAQDYRWKYSEATDAPLSGSDWYAYRDGLVRGYQDELNLPRDEKVEFALRTPTDEEILECARTFALDRFKEGPQHRWNLDENDETFDWQFDGDKIVYSIKDAQISERNPDEHEWYVSVDARPEIADVQIFEVDQSIDGILECDWHGC